MKPLGPNEGIYRLQHPDCRACEERERLNLGIMEENRQLRQKLAKEVRAELRLDEEDGWGFAGSLGDAITNETGTHSLDDCRVEAIAEGIAKWIEAGGQR